MPDAHATVAIRFPLRPSVAQRRACERHLEGERLLYNAARQEWGDSYRHACLLAGMLGMDRPARWRLVELAREAGIAVHEDTLPVRDRASRSKLLAGHRAAWERKPAERAVATAARDKVRAANAALLAAAREGEELPVLRRVPGVPASQPLMGMGLDGRSLTDRQRDALVRLLAWRAPSYESQEGSLTLKAQLAAHAGDGPFEQMHPVAANQRRHTLKRLHGAIQAFHDRCDAGGTPGMPRFKPMGRWDSFGYHEMNGAAFESPPPEAFVHPSGKIGRYKATTGRLTLTGVEGRIRVHMHRPLPHGAEVRSLTMGLVDDAWHVTLRCRVPVLVGVETDDQLRDVTEAQVHALDWGVINTVASNDGRVTVNPRLGAKARTRIEDLQQRISRCKRGSASRRKRVVELRRELRRLARARDTLAHQVSAREVKVALARGCRVLAQEDGDLTNLTRSAKGTVEVPGRMVARKAGYNRAQLDAVPGKVRQYATYKAIRVGIRPVAVPPHGTSRDCSVCDEPVPKDLSERVHACPRCGTVLDRDVNGSSNIGRRGARMLREGTAPPWRRVGREDRREAGSATVGTDVGPVRGKGSTRARKGGETAGAPTG